MSDDVISRLDRLKRLQSRIEIEIERETAFQQRIRRLGSQVRLAVVTRGDWPTRVIATAGHHFSVSADDITGPGRSHDIVDARHVAAWLLRESGWSFPQIGEAMGKDHTTVMHGVKRVDKTPELIAVAAAIRGQLVESSEVA